MNYTYNFSSLLSLALWLAGIGHFSLLTVSFQVPFRLNWKEDLLKLHPLNRKLLWVYGIFIVLTIIAFGTLTLLLHAELMRGDRAALGLAAFIAVFWTLRILIDVFYFRHSDWPPGLRFIIGHVLLMALFVALAGTYWAVLVWNL